MAEREIAYCGLDCADCPAYLAGRTNDDALRAKTAEMWSAPGFGVRPDEVDCDGCRSADGVLFKHCDICDVRGCAQRRGVEDCAACEGYPCARLEELWSYLGEGPRATLDRRRETRLATSGGEADRPSAG